MVVTLADIARRAGVAQSTASAVVNGKAAKLQIAKTTRERVLRACRELNYRPSSSARALATGKTFSIGLVCGGLHLPYFAELASRTMAEAEARGYRLLISTTQWSHEKELQGLDMLLGRQVDGVLLAVAALTPDTAEYQYVTQHRFPVVSFYRSPGIPTVMHDLRPGVTEAVDYLHRLGHRRAGIIAEDANPLKVAPFVERCEQLGLAASVRRATKEIADARAMARELAAEPDFPPVWLVGSDYLAAGVIRGFRDAGLDVPRDVGVIGCDDTPMAAYMHPPLTSVRQDTGPLAARAIDLLMELMDGREPQATPIALPTRLIIRESVLPAKKEC